MPIIALDSENENVHEMVKKLKEIFKLKDIKYTEKRGQIVVTIPRKLSPKEQKVLDEISARKSHENSKPEEEGETSTENAGTVNTTQDQSAATQNPRGS